MQCIHSQGGALKTCSFLNLTFEDHVLIYLGRGLGEICEWFMETPKKRGDGRGAKGDGDSADGAKDKWVYIAYFIDQFLIWSISLKKTFSYLKALPSNSLQLCQCYLSGGVKATRRNQCGNEEPLFFCHWFVWWLWFVFIKANFVWFVY